MPTTLRLPSVGMDRPNAWPLSAVDMPSDRYGSAGSVSCDSTMIAVRSSSRPETTSDVGVPQSGHRQSNTSLSGLVARHFGQAIVTPTSSISSSAPSQAVPSAAMPKENKRAPLTTPDSRPIRTMSFETRSDRSRAAASQANSIKLWAIESSCISQFSLNAATLDCTARSGPLKLIHRFTQINADPDSVRLCRMSKRALLLDLH